MPYINHNIGAILFIGKILFCINYVYTFAVDLINNEII